MTVDEFVNMGLESDSDIIFRVRDKAGNIIHSIDDNIQVKSYKIVKEYWAMTSDSFDIICYIYID